MPQPFISMQVFGFKEIDRVLAALPLSTSKSIVRNALKDAAKPVVSVAQGLAPRDSGQLSTSIAVSTRTTKGQRRMWRRLPGEVMVYIGPSKKGFYGMYHEWGTSKIPARPSMRPAWDQTKDRVLDFIKAALWDRIYKSTKRLAKKRRF